MKLTKKLFILLTTLLLVGCASPEAMPDTTPTPAIESPSATTPDATQTLLTEEAIKAIVLAEVPNGTITEIDRDLNDLTAHYDVTVIHGNVEYDFEIDAYTGAIRGTEKEFDPNPETLTPPTFSEEDAKSIALKEVPGGEITGVTYEGDEFVPHYNISVKLGNYEYDIEIDAQTGAIREIEKDLLP
ncbi:MAG: PepSY domain-containing protein [Cellulosilyticaceae bacterium]